MNTALFVEYLYVASNTRIQLEVNGYRNCRRVKRVCVCVRLRQTKLRGRCCAKVCVCYRLERQMYSLCFHMCTHARMFWCVQHGDVALTALQLCPRLYCIRLKWREMEPPLLSSAVPAHMDNTCCTMCACPQEKFSLPTKM